jgi:hypothetical protein
MIAIQGCIPSKVNYVVYMAHDALHGTEKRAGGFSTTG